MILEILGAFCSFAKIQIEGLNGRLLSKGSRPPRTEHKKKCKE